VREQERLRSVLAVSMEATARWRRAEERDEEIVGVAIGQLRSLGIAFAGCAFCWQACRRSGFVPSSPCCGMSIPYGLGSVAGSRRLGWFVALLFTLRLAARSPWGAGIRALWAPRDVTIPRVVVEFVPVVALRDMTVALTSRRGR
jgi:hypothetical protein